MDVGALLLAYSARRPSVRQDYDGFDLANETDQLHQFLKLSEGEVNTAQDILTANRRSSSREVRRQTLRYRDEKRGILSFLTARVYLLNTNQSNLSGCVLRSHNNIGALNCSRQMLSHILGTHLNPVCEGSR